MKICAYIYNFFCCNQEAATKPSTPHSATNTPHSNVAILPDSYSSNGPLAWPNVYNTPPSTPPEDDLDIRSHSSVTPPNTPPEDDLPAVTEHKEQQTESTSLLQPPSTRQHHQYGSGLSNILRTTYRDIRNDAAYAEQYLNAKAAQATSCEFSQK